MATRRERVVLEVESDLAPTMLRDATAVALLKRELHGLSGQAVITSRATRNMSRDNDEVARSAAKADRGINQLTGRLRLFADLAAILGPALIPIGAVGIPALAGLANQMGVAALAGGTMVLAFQSVFDTLKLVNTAALDPTAENIDKAREALERLDPVTQSLVMRLQDLRPVFEDLRDTSAEGLFPGVLDGIDELEARVPDLERILSAVSTETGRLFDDSAASLASGRWDDFFHALETEAPSTLSAMVRTLGSLTHGFSELWIAFDPLSDDFTSWLEDSAAGFDRFATGVDKTEGFAEFLDYVRTEGPQVADTAGAVADAVLQIVEAAAPLGGPTLHALEAVANSVAAIADSNLGTPLLALASGLALVSRAQATFNTVTEKGWGAKAKANVTGMATALGTVTSAQQRATLTATELTRVEAARAAEVRKGLATIGRGAAGIAALTLATSGAADGMGLTNTATLALMGTLAGPWGAVVGGAVGLTMDMAAANNDLEDAAKRASAALHDQPEAFEANAQLMTQYTEQFQAFKDKVEGTGDFWTDFGRGLNPASWGNAFEEIFGTSEVDEQRQALLDLQETYTRQKQAVSDLANEVRGNDVWVDYTKNLQDLQGVASSLQPAMDHFGITIEDLGNADPRLFAIYTDSIKGFIAEADSVPGRTRSVADAISGLDDDLLSTADSADKLSAALDQLLGPGLDAEAATSAYQQSLDDLRNELKANFGFTQAIAQGRKNLELTRTVFEDTLKMLTTRAADGASSGQIAKLVLQSRDAFIQEGVAAGFSAKQMRQRANELGLTPKLVKTVFEAAGIDIMAAKARGIANQLEKMPKAVQVELRNKGYDLTKAQIADLQKKYDLTPEQVDTILRAKDQASAVIKEVDDRAQDLHDRETEPKISADASAAYRAIYGVAGALHQIPDETVWINVRTNRIGGVTSSYGGHSDDRKAAGGAINGPGTGTSDSVPIWASHGEHMWTAREVVNAGGHAAVEALRAHFRYAGGGAIGGRPSDAGHVALRIRPSINVGAPHVTVLLDGRELRHEVRVEMADQDRYDEQLDDRGWAPR